MSANRRRGEISAQLDGKPHRLCLTLGALAELEATYAADDLAALVERFSSGRLSALDMIRLVGAGLRGAAGLYDGASVQTLLVNWRKPEDFVVLRTASIGRITRSDERFVAELESLAGRLDQPNGRSVRRLCDAELGDARCTFALDRPGYRASGSVASVSTPDRLSVSGLDAFDPGWFSYGTLTWTKGARAGRSERIVDHRVRDGEVVLVLQPRVGFAVSAGDTFSLVSGCDKRFATCKEKFSNSLNFRGFPHLPGNDAAYAYVSDGGNFDGGPVVP